MVGSPPPKTRSSEPDWALFAASDELRLIVDPKLAVQPTVLPSNWTFWSWREPGPATPDAPPVPPLPPAPDEPPLPPLPVDPPVAEDPPVPEPPEPGALQYVGSSYPEAVIPHSCSQQLASQKSYRTKAAPFA